MPKPPIANPFCTPQQPGDLLAARAAFFQTIRQFFCARGFLEVETPVLIPRADPSPHLDSFRTTLRPGHSEYPESLPIFLRTSPEFAMKRLLAAGYPKLFQICKFFRNDPITEFHNPEFTGLEWYAIHEDYHLLMDLTEQMCRQLWPTDTLVYQGRTLDISSPWERLTVHQAMARYANLQLPDHITRGDLVDACRKAELSVQSDDDWDDLFFKLFLTFVEPHLGMERPTFLLDYPAPMAALARTKPGAPHLAERVELYIAGIELANGYSELIDPTEQRKRWLQEGAFRQQRGDDIPYPPDEGLLNALEWGMPPTAGIAVGLDRLFMLSRNAATIQEVLPFPIAQELDFLTPS